MKLNKGISLIVLVITIIVVIILAGAVILSLSNNNPIMQAKEATFKTSMDAYNSELTMYISNQYVTNAANFNPSNLNASTVAEIKSILTDVTDEFASKLRIVKGSLSYIGTDSNEIKWAKENNISLDVPYVKSGLVLWYDGVYNGGIGIHNDNTNANKGIWKDLSTSANDGNLFNFAYDTTSGWGESYLNIGTVTSHVMPTVPMTYSTVQIVYETDKSIWNYPIDARSYIAEGWAAVGYGVGAPYTKPFKDGITDSSLSVLPSNKVASITIKVSPTDNVLPTIGARYSKNESLMGKMYSIRIYNRLLTESEIAQNFEIDKVRFGAN